MGVTKRKKSAKKKSAKKAAPEAPLLECLHSEDLLHELTVAYDAVVVALTRLDDALEEGDAVEVAPEVHEQAKYLCDIESWGKKVRARLRDLYYGLREKGAVFAAGRFAPQFAESSRRSPAWKEEAIRLRKEVAALKDEEDFDPKVYESQVLAQTPASRSRSLKFAEIG